jgi:hypothetical protein
VRRFLLGTAVPVGNCCAARRVPLQYRQLQQQPHYSNVQHSTAVRIGIVGTLSYVPIQRGPNTPYPVSPIGYSYWYLSVPMSYHDGNDRNPTGEAR